MKNPNNIDEILKKVVACTITIEEDRALNTAAKKAKEDGRLLNGWQRYFEANIKVYDTITFEQVKIGNGDK